MLLTDIEIVENYLQLDTGEGAVMDAFLRIKKKAMEAQPQADNSAMPKLLCLLEELVGDIEFDGTIQSAYYKQKLAELRSATSA